MMEMNSESFEWAGEWVCKCGLQFRQYSPQFAMFHRVVSMPDSRFLAFGFSKPCPKCGGELGSHGPKDQATYRVGRFVQVTTANTKYRWWNPLSWPKKFVEYKHQTRSE